ncbi:hypothetical protein SAMN05216600_12851 [Pseudomonas cuatrocienegasensis]|uniref:Uncharacterized protein n=1 Tax=Pseudomonas cuatrocienegasensis TaxID=543360 RepID=A0ABY1BR16_9PSED|nr:MULTISPECIES: hypothetical protein [Pseudomonas]OEC32899.1 hypothetical protein A7D25_21895 [Pseudomonas sp. 21C1]SER41835.1 hypothetical protein SAMN05216600_12851 [Pseudomonas cuatrocienegasensis]
MSRSPKQIAAGQRQSLQAMARKIKAMAAEWADVDAFNEGELESLGEKIEELAAPLGGLVAE